MQIIHVALSTVTVSSLPAAVQARGNADGELGTVKRGTGRPHPEASSILSVAAAIASFLPSSSFSSFSFLFF